MSMLRRCAAASVILVLALAAAAGAVTGRTADQSTLPVNGSGTGKILGATPDGQVHAAAQTFTAAHTGFVDVVSVAMWTPRSADGRYRLSVQSTVPGNPDGRPTGTELGHGVIDMCRTPGPSGLIDVALSPAAPVIAGIRYAVVLAPDPLNLPDAQAVWTNGMTPLGDDQHPEASLFERVDVPAPAWATYSGLPSLAVYVSPSPPAPAAAPVATAVTLTATPDPVKRSRAMTLTAHVTDTTRPAAIPAGTVRFDRDGLTVATAPLDATATATRTVSWPTAGAKRVSASFCPAGVDLLSADASKTVTVSADMTATHTALTVTPSALVAYQDATLQATVTAEEPGGPTPTGTVQFAEQDGGPIGGPVALDAAGHATLHAGAPAGSYVLTAAYSGDGLYTASQATLPQTVTTAGTVTSVDAAPNPAAFGAQIEWFVDVSALAPSGGLPTGDILISVDGAAPDRFALDAFAQADLGVTGLPAGAHTVTVSYPGDGDFRPSAFTFTQTVTGGPPALPLAPLTKPLPPPAPPEIARLTARGLAAAVRIPATVRVPRSGVIRLGTAANPPLRSLTVEVRGTGANTRTARARWTAASTRPLLGRTQLTIAAGARRAVTVRLNAKARAQVRRAGRLLVAVRLTARDRTGATVRATVNRTLTRARR
jgi:hypothetical protein